MNQKLSNFLQKLLWEANKAGLFVGLIFLGIVVVIVWVWRTIYGEEEGL